MQHCQVSAIATFNKSRSRQLHIDGLSSLCTSFRRFRSWYCHILTSLNNLLVIITRPTYHKNALSVNALRIPQSITNLADGFIITFFHFLSICLQEQKSVFSFLKKTFRAAFLRPSGVPFLRHLRQMTQVPLWRLNAEQNILDPLV